MVKAGVDSTDANRAITVFIMILCNGKTVGLHALEVLDESKCFKRMNGMEE